MIRLLRTDVTIPTWALFLALLVVSAVTAFIYGQSMAESLAHRAVESGVFGGSVHLESHDPVEDWPHCTICGQALSASFAVLADMDLGPNGSGRLVEVLRAEASKAIAHGAAS